MGWQNKPYSSVCMWGRRWPPRLHFSRRSRRQRDFPACAFGGCRLRLMVPRMDFRERCQRVKLLLMDCDGVLTDGRLYFSEQGEELKAFHVRDGQGIVN